MLNKYTVEFCINVIQAGCVLQRCSLHRLTAMKLTAKLMYENLLVVVRQEKINILVSSVVTLLPVFFVCWKHSQNLWI